MPAYLEIHNIHISEVLIHDKAVIFYPYCSLIYLIFDNVLILVVSLNLFISSA